MLTRRQTTEWIVALAITGILTIVANYVGYEAALFDSLPGLAWLLGFTFVGLVMKALIPWNLPAVAYISFIAILFALPIHPLSGMIIEQVEKVSLLALCTPILAYAGVTVGHDWPAFKKIGWRGILVSITTITATVLACVLLSELLFRIF